ncbi:hypothetical protein LWX53_05410 [bacterium]|nr:hypothetical protein [bacterium]
MALPNHHYKHFLYDYIDSRPVNNEYFHHYDKYHHINHCTLDDYDLDSSSDNYQHYYDNCHATTEDEYADWVKNYRKNSVDCLLRMESRL